MRPRAGVIKALREQMNRNNVELCFLRYAIIVYYFTKSLGNCAEDSYPSSNLFADRVSVGDLGPHVLIGFSDMNILNTAFKIGEGNHIIVQRDTLSL